MNIIRFVVVVLLGVMQWSVARADYSSEAVVVARDVFGLQHGRICNEQGTLTQWKFVRTAPQVQGSGFTQVPSSRDAPAEVVTYVDAWDFSEPVAQGRSAGSREGRMIEWYGVVEWYASSHRSYSTATGLLSGSHKRPVFRIVLEKVEGYAWSIIDPVQPTPATPQDACVDLTTVVHPTPLQRRKEYRPQPTIRPPTLDPYYQGPVRNTHSRECFPGAGRACYN